MGHLMREDQSMSNEEIMASQSRELTADEIAKIKSDSRPMSWEEINQLKGYGAQNRISIQGCRTFLHPEDKPSEVVREVVKANDDFWAKVFGFVLAVVAAGGTFAILHHFAKIQH